MQASMPFERLATPPELDVFKDQASILMDKFTEKKYPKSILDRAYEEVTILDQEDLTVGRKNRLTEEKDKKMPLSLCILVEDQDIVEVDDASYALGYDFRHYRLDNLGKAPRGRAEAKRGQVNCQKKRR
ncbi:Hypothetical predicted protein [Pelobates cultripes]|uniref:Uncharacterized protein n=1 Tax=Pelobates cultripes TaxID=61616 RepID=A0AAD1QXF6_PELCU|nr:Hypothetical predicted protein [Pelobates cultripes]